MTEHEPDPSACVEEAGGQRFLRPFRCACCGAEVCARQFAYGKMCGPCDTGQCGHPAMQRGIVWIASHPAWERDPTTHR
jgi:hypothetical protein